MLFGRFWRALAGAGHRRVPGEEEDTPREPGTLPTHTPLFIVVLVGMVLLVGALTFFPAWRSAPSSSSWPCIEAGHFPR